MVFIKPFESFPWNYVFLGKRLVNSLAWVVMQHLWKIAAAENSFLASSWEKVDFPSFFISPAFQAADRSSRLELRRVSTFL